MPRWIQRRTPPFDLIPEDQYVGENPHRLLVVGDLPDVISPVTGEILHGRRGMREHMRRHNLAHADDFKQHWQDKAKEREKFQKGEHPTHRREVRESILRSIEKLGG